MFMGGGRKNPSVPVSVVCTVTGLNKLKLHRLICSPSRFPMVVKHGPFLSHLPKGGYFFNLVNFSVSHDVAAGEDEMGQHAALCLGNK